MKSIGDSLGKFIKVTGPKGSKYFCARICVEVSLDKGFPEAILLHMDGKISIWTMKAFISNATCGITMDILHVTAKNPKLLSEKRLHLPWRMIWNWMIRTSLKLRFVRKEAFTLSTTESQGQPPNNNRCQTLFDLEIPDNEGNRLQNLDLEKGTPHSRISPSNEATSREETTPQPSDSCIMEEIAPKNIAAIQTSTENAVMGPAHTPVGPVMVKELQPSSQEAEHWIIKANRII